MQELTATSMIFSPFRLHAGMYTSFFGLGEKPFAITPDPRYLFMSERHAEALAHLLYGINEAGGFIQLTGEVGTARPPWCARSSSACRAMPTSPSSSTRN